MDQVLEVLKTELEEFGEENDAVESERSHCMLNITRDTGELLSVLIRATSAKDILEIGTSNGYSTLWLAEAAKVNNGHVTTVEYLKLKQKLALNNFHRSGLSNWIKSVLSDAGQVLEQLDDTSVDFIFLDSERSEYVSWWNHINRILRPRGLLVVDNALSHVDEMAAFSEVLKSDPDFEVCLVPVGKGELIATKSCLLNKAL